MPPLFIGNPLLRLVDGVATKYKAILAVAGKGYSPRMGCNVEQYMNVERSFHFRLE